MEQSSSTKTRKRAKGQFIAVFRSGLAKTELRHLKSNNPVVRDISEHDKDHHYWIDYTRRKLGIYSSNTHIYKITCSSFTQEDISCLHSWLSLSHHDLFGCLVPFTKATIKVIRLASDVLKMNYLIGHHRAEMWTAARKTVRYNRLDPAFTKELDDAANSYFHAQSLKTAQKLAQIHAQLPPLY